MTNGNTNNIAGSATFLALQILASGKKGGSGSAFEPFPATWPTGSTATTADFCAAVNADTNATVGHAYLGEVTWSDLPASMANAEVVVEIMGGSGTSNKVIHLVCTSGNQPPYRWEYTYWDNGSNTSGWVGFQPEPFEIPIAMGESGSWSTPLTFNQIRDAIQNYGTNMVISMEGIPISVNSAGYDASEGEGHAVALAANGEDQGAINLIGLAILLENNSVSVEVMIIPLDDNAYVIPLAEVGEGEFTTSATPDEIAAAMADNKRILVSLGSAIMPAIIITNDGGDVLVESTLYDLESGGAAYFVITGNTESQPCDVTLHAQSGGGSAPFEIEVEWRTDPQTGESGPVVVTSPSDVFDALSSGKQVVVVDDEGEHYTPVFVNCNTTGTRIYIQCVDADYDHSSIGGLEISGNKNRLSAEYRSISIPSQVPYFEIIVEPDPEHAGSYITSLSASEIVTGIHYAGTNTNIIVSDGDGDSTTLHAASVKGSVDGDDTTVMIQGLGGAGADHGGVMSCTIKADSTHNSVNISIESEIPDQSPFKIECEWRTDPQTQVYGLHIITDPSDIVDAVQNGKSIMVVIDGSVTYNPVCVSFEEEDNFVYIRCEKPDTDHSEIVITIISGSASNMSAEQERMNVARYSAGDNIRITGSTIAVTSGVAVSGKALISDGTGSASWGDITAATFVDWS